MTVYSWNMLFRNRELPRAFAFIAESDFDLFCLQEVPDAFLARLRTLPYHLAEAVDVDRLFRPRARNHLVILSRYPIMNTGTMQYPDYWPDLCWYTKLFVHLMRLFHWSKVANRNGLYADIDTPGKSLRVFNLHLILGRPRSRLKEFETAMALRDLSRATIVCGDFNTIESPYVSPLNWLLGGSAADMLFYRRERTLIEKHFVEHELVNPLRGETTHSFAESQLDHILVSRTLFVRAARVVPDRVGSDHHPIRVEIV